MHLRLLQLRVDRSERADARIERVRGLLTAGNPADLTVLPELWLQGAFDMDLFASTAQTLDGPAVTMIKEVASESKKWIHGGSIIVEEEGKLFNTSFLVDPHGAIAAIYKKIHLFGFDGGEATILSPGTELVTTAIAEAKIGMTTCYDLRFPEQYRTLTDQGADLFLIPMGWPERRIDHMRTLAQARAIENQAFVVAVNAVGRSGDVLLYGNSMVIDPWGHIVAEAGQESEEILDVEIDLSQVLKTRETFPVLRDR